MSFDRTRSFWPDSPRRCVVALFALALAGGGACSRQLPIATETRLIGYSVPLQKLMGDCSALSESQLSQACSKMAERIKACTAVRAVCSAQDSDCALAENAVCVEPATLDGEGIQPGAWRLTGPLPEALGGGNYSVEAATEPTAASNDFLNLSVSLQLDPSGRAADWLPSASDRGFGLNAKEAFAQVRYRPRGGLVFQRQGELTLADRLYGLRSELFTAAVLTGDVELAMMVPAAGEQFPGLVAALDFKLKKPAVAAMESYIADLQREWPMTRSPVTIAGHQGACLSNLRVMPGLAPCYVATETAIVVGWNQAVLTAALPYRPSEVVDGNRAVIDLDRLGIADHRIAEQRGRVSAFTYPSGRVLLTPAADASPSEGQFQFWIRHVPSAGTSAGRAEAQQ